MKVANTEARKVEAWRERAARYLSRRLPQVLLALLIGLHVVLAAAFHVNRQYYPPPIQHDAYKTIVDMSKVLRGYFPTYPASGVNPGNKTIFDGTRQEDFRLYDPRTLWRELSRGQLKGLWRNHEPRGYFNEISLPSFVPALVHLISGGSILAASLAPQIFLAILLLSIYGIGRQSGGPWIGLAAAAIASGYPGLFELSRTHYDALASGALATALVYLLLRSDGFSRMRICAAAGAVAFLAARTGESISCSLLIALIAVGPLILQIIRLVRKFDTASPRAWRCLVGMSLFFLPLLLFDWTRIPTFWKKFSASQVESGVQAEVGAHVPQLLAGVISHLSYLFHFAFELLQPMMTLWLLAGAVLLRRAPRGNRLPMVLMVLVPLVPLSLMDKKATWYVIPILSALALITAMGLQGLSTPERRRWALGLASVCGILTLLLSSLVPAHYLAGISLDRISPAIKQTATVPGFPHGYLTGSAGIKVKTLAQVSHDFVAHVRKYPTPAPGPTLVAVFGKTTEPVESFRYMVELSQPELFVVDIMNPCMDFEYSEKLLSLLAGAPFHYLIYLDKESLLPWPPNSWDAFRMRVDMHPSPQKMTREDAFRRIKELEQELARADEKLAGARERLAAERARRKAGKATPSRTFTPIETVGKLAIRERRLGEQREKIRQDLLALKADRVVVKAKLRRAIKKLRQRKWVRVDLPSGPIYQVSR